MAEIAPPGRNACCGGASGAACVFSKALLARSAVCERAERRSVGERELIECSSPVALMNCGTLAALLHERARFALRLPSPGQPVMHAQALRLQCGGLVGLQQALAIAQPDVHRMVGAAHERYGSLMELPWDAIVQALKQWQPRQPRRRPSPPEP
jgi:hypothetical protein